MCPQPESPLSSLSNEDLEMPPANPELEAAYKRYSTAVSKLQAWDEATRSTRRNRSWETTVTALRKAVEKAREGVEAAGDSPSEQPAPLAPTEQGTSHLSPAAPPDSPSEEPAPLAPAEQDSPSEKPAPLVPAEQGTSRLSPAASPKDSPAAALAPTEQQGASQLSPASPPDSPSEKPAPLTPAEQGTSHLLPAASPQDSPPAALAPAEQQGKPDERLPVLSKVDNAIVRRGAGRQKTGNANGGQGLGGGLADMTVMDNLAHRSKDQVEEMLSLISELMPPLPKDGVFDHKGYTEKSLGRMIKAKAKVEWAAARQATHATLAATMLITPASTPAAGPSSTLAAATPDDTASAETVIAELEEDAAAAPDRFELLRSKPAVVGRFMQLMVPILIHVYAASVITLARVKILTGLLKAVSFLDADSLKRMLTSVPVASFASLILSSKGHPTLVIGTLQLVNLLLAKVPALYKPMFCRKGVFHETETLSECTIVTAAKPKEKEKEKEKETSESPAPPDTVPDIPPPAPAPTPAGATATIPGFKKLSSLSLEPKDAITLRARVIQFKYLSDDEKAVGDGSFGKLQRLVERLLRDASEKDMIEVLHELAELFGAPHSFVSSFELLQSGMVDGLLQFAMDGERKLSLARRKELLLDAFAGRRTKVLGNAQTPFVTFVKKLQESLMRMQSFDVITVAQGIDDSKRSFPSLLARQLRLCLVAGDESDVPRNLHNIVVSIHAIAIFQALHDYLCPRVAGLLGGGSRLSGMLAALAASGFNSASTIAPPAAAAESSSAGAAALGSTITRWRSQRLSAKNAPAADGAASDAPVAGSSSDGAAGSSVEGGPLSNMIDSEMAADFTNKEVDAEVIDDVDLDNSISDKTNYLLKVFLDGSKVEAQTPDGTRVATPSLKDGQPPALHALTTRALYASALKTKPTDWHLEFSMDNQILPLDLIIYGAMHQHEMRKKTGALPPNLIWQGVYTVKFKKVPGPLPAADARPEGAEGTSKSWSPSPTLSSLPEDPPHAKILRLLRVLHQLNTLEAERSVFIGEKRNLPGSAFVNNKLTAKLTRQLEEPMIVAGTRSSLRFLWTFTSPGGEGGAQAENVKEGPEGPMKPLKAENPNPNPQLIPRIPQPVAYGYGFAGYGYALHAVQPASTQSSLFSPKSMAVLQSTDLRSPWTSDNAQKSIYPFKVPAEQQDTHYPPLAAGSSTDKRQLMDIDFVDGDTQSSLDDYADETSQQMHIDPGTQPEFSTFLRSPDSDRRPHLRLVAQISIRGRERRIRRCVGGGGHGEWQGHLAGGMQPWGTGRVPSHTAQTAASQEWGPYPHGNGGVEDMLAVVPSHTVATAASQAWGPYPQGIISYGYQQTVTHAATKLETPDLLSRPQHPEDLVDEQAKGESKGKAKAKANGAKANGAEAKEARVRKAKVKVDAKEEAKEAKARARARARAKGKGKGRARKDHQGKGEESEGELEGALRAVDEEEEEEGAGEGEDGPSVEGTFPQGTRGKVAEPLREGKARDIIKNWGLLTTVQREVMTGTLPQRRCPHMENLLEDPSDRRGQQKLRPLGDNDSLHLTPGCDADELEGPEVRIRVFHCGCEAEEVALDYFAWKGMPTITREVGGDPKRTSAGGVLRQTPEDVKTVTQGADGCYDTGDDNAIIGHKKIPEGESLALIHLNAADLKKWAAVNQAEFEAEKGRAAEV
ncbi:hypothetical protein B0H17DRAFT_1127779 [Mycena rosella]|uniref:Uncharacterized protein n=1 Tax=Mycena rosella TaxID=1033263 RepID=A0AAD7DYS2_MYCRO|nr:hypothetical protein B0H17DRAFT_1127779 [Mycena rosella]